MGNAGDNTKDNTTNSKIVSDELYLYSLKKMADLNAKKNESPLTGLYGIKAFFYEANELMKNNSDKKFAVIRMDIYHFKTVNEFCGREEADKLLKYISGLFCDYEGEFCVAGHFRADIFVLCTSFDDKQELIDIVNSIRSRIDQYNIQCKVLPAFGICINHNNMDVSLMCDYADLAIKKIKGKVFKTYEFYDNAMRESMLLEKKIENDVLPALKNDYIKAYVQPKVDMHNGHIIGGEALVRWQHPKRGLLSPGMFIDALEKNGFLYRLDIYMWNKAAKQLSDWKKRGIEKYHISVNISTKDFYLIDVYETFTSLVEKYDISPKLLKLEITETALMSDFDKNILIIKKLQDYGFDIEIDDFGSGYSSLNMLKDISADVLKIDMGFLRASENEVKGQDILESIIELANKLGMKVITEGVEKKSQLDMLSMMGCKMFQGYYFSKPIPVDEFEEKYKLGQE